MHFKIDWASFYWEGNLPFLLCFTFVFENKFHVQAPRGTYIRRGDLTEGFLRYDFEGLMHGGAYFRNFTVLSSGSKNAMKSSKLKEIKRSKVFTTFFFDLSCTIRLNAFLEKS